MKISLDKVFEIEKLGIANVKVPVKGVIRIKKNEIQMSTN